MNWTMMLVTLGLVGAPVIAQPLPPVQAAASDQQLPPLKKKATGRLICKSIEQIGSRLATKRTCMTAEQWEQQKQIDRDLVQQTQERTYQPHL